MSDISKVPESVPAEKAAVESGQPTDSIELLKRVIEDAGVFTVEIPAVEEIVDES